MTSSSESGFVCALDSVLIVYAFLEGHPANLLAEAFIRGRSGWFTTSLALFEVRAVLTKVYGLDAKLITMKLERLCQSPVSIVPVDARIALASFQLADTHRLDSADAALLHLSLELGTSLATDDVHLSRVCEKLGLVAENPIDQPLRRAITAWEEEYLPVKGLPRMLRAIRGWLQSACPEAVPDFWSGTGGGSHLP